MLADAREKAGPAIAAGAAVAAEKIATSASLAAEKAAEAAETAADKIAEVADPPKKKGSKLKKLLLITGLAAGLAFVASKLRAGKESESWQSSYTPTPAPSPSGSGADDGGGASPAEALADQAETPHPVTTPDQPAEVVDVDYEKK